MADRYISLKPSDAVKGGGMVAEGEYDISDAKFGPWDYGGTVEVPVTALGVEYKTGDQTFTQWYSAGDAKNLVPSEDGGKRLKAVGSATGLNESTNCYAFIQSLVNGGFNEDKLADDISVIIGARVEVMHQATPDRKIGDKQVAKRMIAVIRRVISLPGDKSDKAKKAAPQKKSNGSETAASGDVSAKAAHVLVDVLKANGKQLEKRAISTAIFKTMPATDPDRSDILQLCIQDSFLGGLQSSNVLYDKESGIAYYMEQ